MVSVVSRSALVVARGVLAGVLGLVLLVVLVPVRAVAAGVEFSSTPVGSWRLNGVGYATLLVGNTVYVGGSFSSASSPTGSSSVSRVNLAAFNAATGALVAGFRADTDGRVDALATDGNSLFVGGSFTHVNGSYRGRLAAVSLTSGALRSWTADASSNVYALGAAGGTLFVGGSFGSIKGVSRSRLAAVRISDGSLTSFAPAANATVNALAVRADGGAVYAGGNFTTISGTSRPYLAGFTGSGSLTSVGWARTSAPVTSLSLRPDGARLAVGYAGYQNQTSYYSTSSGSRLWANYCGGDAQAVAVIEDSVFSGYHDECRGDSTTKLVKVDAGNGVTDSSFHPTFNRFWGVRGISGNADTLAIAGDFTRISGVSVQGFAIFRRKGAPADIAAPSVPSGVVVADSTTADSLRVSWDASSDDVDVVGYRVFRGGVDVSGLVPGTSFTDTAVSRDTNYIYQVAAFDAAGNSSGLSRAVTGIIRAPGRPPQTSPGQEKAATHLAAKVSVHHSKARQKVRFSGALSPTVLSAVGLPVKLSFKARGKGKHHFKALRVAQLQPGLTFRFKKVSVTRSGKYRIRFAGSGALLPSKVVFRYTHHVHRFKSLVSG